MATSQNTTTDDETAQNAHVTVASDQVTDEQRASAADLAERYSDECSVGCYGSTGTIDLTVPLDAVPEERCINVGPVDAPDGYEFVDASLHPDGGLHAVFEQAEDTEGGE